MIASLPHSHLSSNERLPFAAERRKMLRQDYIEGKGNMRELCLRYSLKLGWIKQLAAKERWTDLRIRWDQAERNRFDRTNQPLPAVDPSPVLKSVEVQQNETNRARIQEQMLVTRDPSELRDLAMAYDRLFQAWCILTGTAKPAPVKTTVKERPIRSEVAPGAAGPSEQADDQPVEDEQSPL